MIKQLLKAALICFAIPISAQTVEVLNKSNFKPLSNVAVYNSEKNIGTTTNLKGKADISAFNDNDTLSFQLVGYFSQSLTKKQIEQQNFKVYLAEKSYDLNEIVVSASKFEEKRKDVAHQIQVINAKEIEFMGQQTTPDLLQQSGNVLVQKSQAGGGSPIIRGFEANKVLLVVDGVRMNNAIYRGGHLQNSMTIDNNMLENLEIVFGPGSVIYGSDALGGVIHFHTKKPEVSDNGKVHFKGNAFTRYSTANQEKTGHIDFNLGLNKIAFLTSINYSDFGDVMQGNIRNDFYGNWGHRRHEIIRIDNKDSMVLTNNINLQTQSAYKQYDVMQKILYKQSDKISHTLNFQYSTTSNLPRYDRLNTYAPNGKLRDAEWYYGPQERLFAAYHLDLNAEKGIYSKARVTLAYQDIEESRHTRRRGNNWRRSQIENVKVYSINADFDKKIGQNEIRYGIEGVFNGVSSKSSEYNIVTDTTRNAATRYPNGGSEYITAAAYLTHSWEISPKLIFSQGIRFNVVTLNAKFTDTSFYKIAPLNYEQNTNAVNGNIGLVYMPGYDWRFSILGSTGFRNPNVDDLGKVFDTQPGLVIVPNPGIKPEYTYNGDFNISKTINKQVTLYGTVFYTHIQDLIATDKFTYNGQDSILYQGVLSKVVANQNKNQAYIYGFNAGINADVTQAFSIVSTINYTYGRIKTDTTDYPLDHIPPVFGKTSFILKLKKFKGEFFMLYNGWKRVKDYNMFGEDNFGYATVWGNPAWITLNVRTSYQISKNFQVQAALENILDQNYRIFASGISAPGRNFMITLRAKF